MAAADVTTMEDAPVMTMMNKRLRALKKKYNRIMQIEESKLQGKTINKEQEDVLKCKVQVAALIEEYERLRQPLMAAVKEEIAEREKEWLAAKGEDVQIRDKEGTPSNTSTEEVRTESEDGSNGVLNGDINGGEGHDKTSLSHQVSVGSFQEEARSALSDEQLADLIQLLYFAQLFDVKSQGDASFMWTKYHERSSCLSYDFVADDVTSPLSEADLEALAMFGSLVTSRPPNVTLSHKDALQNCISHARLWLLNSDHPIHELNTTYTDLRERLNRILSSEYFTMTAELQPLTQQLAEAAATASAQYGSKSVGHEAQEVDASSYTNQEVGQEQQYFNGDSPQVSVENGDSVPSLVSDSSMTNVEVSQCDDGNQVIPKASSVSEEERAEQEPREHDQNGQAQDERQQQHNVQQHVGVGSNRYQGSRGGGRGGYGRGRGYSGGGYSNGRGGRGNRGGYSNGRGGGQYYDQGGYYQRSYNGGGRRGGRGYYTAHAANGPSSAVAAESA